MTRFLSITLFTLLSLLPPSPQFPADAASRIGFAFDAHNATGTGYPADSLSRYDLTALYGNCPSGWFYDFGYDARGGDDSRLSYGIQMLWSVPDSLTLESVIMSNPGDIFVVGNEPNLSSQNNLATADYATFYHDAYTAIKAIDSSYPVAIGAVHTIDAGTISYLQAVLSDYQQQYGKRIPIDTWTIHAYGYTPIQEQIQNMRAFMATNGYQDTPLWVTEFNVSPEQIEPIYTWLLTATSDQGLPADDYRNVQRFAHFALNSYGEWPNYAFDKLTRQPTEFAAAFKAFYQSNFPCQFQFFPFMAG